MGIQKVDVEGRMLKRIPLGLDYEEDDSEYAAIKKLDTIQFEQVSRQLSKGMTIFNAVITVWDGWCSEAMYDNGMEKLCHMLAGMVYSIENNYVEPDLAYGTIYDINEFESGDYDDCVSALDMKLMKADIEIIKEYVNSHPELWENGFTKEELLEAGIVDGKYVHCIFRKPGGKHDDNRIDKSV